MAANSSDDITTLTLMEKIAQHDIMTAMLYLTLYSAHDIPMYISIKCFMSTARYVEWISAEYNLYFKRSQ